MPNIQNTAEVFANKQVKGGKSKINRTVLHGL